VLPIFLGLRLQDLAFLARIGLLICTSRNTGELFSRVAIKHSLDVLSEGSSSAYNQVSLTYSIAFTARSKPLSCPLYHLLQQFFFLVNVSWLYPMVLSRRANFISPHSFHRLATKSEHGILDLIHCLLLTHLRQDGLWDEHGR
jgi:hypothetical protein